jgi:alpha-beta hydrolase superfamily lysophospholipase
MAMENNNLAEGSKSVSLSSYETASGRINVIDTLSENPNGDALLCIHGFPCDARIFGYAASKLSKAGYDVYSMDLPGHGKSDGKKGDLDFDICLTSINQIVTELKKKSKRVFILAHSMGSIFALWYAHRFPNSINGLILLAPYIRVRGVKRSDAEPTTTTFLKLLIGRLFFPNKRVNLAKVSPGFIQIGGSQIARMTLDKELNFDYTYRYFVDIIASRNNKIGVLKDITVPVLILHGSKDRNVYPQVSEKFFKLLRTENKEIRVFDCNHWFYDAIFFSQTSEYSEQDRLQVISSIVEWLGKF